MKNQSSDSLVEEGFVECALRHSEYPIHANQIVAFAENEFVFVVPAVIGARKFLADIPDSN